MKEITINKDYGIKASLPTAWAETTERQKKYLFRLKADGWQQGTIRMLAVIRFAGIKVGRFSGTAFRAKKKNAGFMKRGKTFPLTLGDAENIADTLSFVDGFDSSPRLERMGRGRAVDVILRGVPFADYLTMEKHYQDYLTTENPACLVRLACLLYRRRNGSPMVFKRLKEWQMVAVFYWYSYIKQHFAALFPHFLRPRAASIDGDKSKNHRYMEQVNIQIRALTGGDITKETAINATDTLRALTELDIKAQEAAELKRQLKK